MANLTSKQSEVALFLFNMLDTNKLDLGIRAVYYGDQTSIPDNPSVCIDTGNKDQELNKAPRGIIITFNIYILVYHNMVQGVEDQRLQNDQLDEAIEDLIHTNRNLSDPPGPDGLVIHGFVVGVEPGWMVKGTSVIRASRIRYQATSQVQLPSTP